MKAKKPKSSKRAKGPVFSREPPPILAHMTEVSRREAADFRSRNSSVLIEKTEVKLAGPYTVLAVGPPKEYRPERTTVWSFPDRGDWATHSGDYRGNWSPYIPRNLILRYSLPGDLVLDPMVGSGTTLTECRLLGRRAIGVDVNPDAVMVARDRLDFGLGGLDPDHVEPDIKTFVGDARSLDRIPDDSIDLVATHPPYAGIVSYTSERIPSDLSSSRGINGFIDQSRVFAKEFYRVTKPGKHCAILMGDTRRHRHMVPISVRVMQAFMEAGFVLREDITKIQWKMKSTRENWTGSKYDFLLLAHEHLYVFRKLGPGESGAEFKDSTRWW
jgi:DNA modification methylase